jgi:hypothetical protein
MILLLLDDDHRITLDLESSSILLLAQVGLLSCTIVTLIGHHVLVINLNTTAVQRFSGETICPASRLILYFLEIMLSIEHNCLLHIWKFPQHHNSLEHELNEVFFDLKIRVWVIPCHHNVRF